MNNNALNNGIYRTKLVQAETERTRITPEEYDKLMDLYMNWQVFRNPSEVESAEANKICADTSERFHREYYDYLKELLEKYNQPHGYSYTVDKDRTILRYG